MSGPFSRIKGMGGIIMRVIFKDNGAVFTGIKCFNLARSCACGQAFRWEKRGDGWMGVVSDRCAVLKQEAETLYINPCTPHEAAKWREYLDLDGNYAGLEDKLRANKALSVCLPCSSGIHVFTQEPFETLISFIISANNNLGRIQGIIGRLCAAAGEAMDTFTGIKHKFPTPCALARIPLEALRSLGLGYRAPFIHQTAGIIAEGYDLLKLRDLPLEDARKELMRFPGVGPKVADCALLFSLGHTRAFPMDVWMNRAMREIWFGGQSFSGAQKQAAISELGELAGIVQQYVFYYARESKLGA